MLRLGRRFRCVPPCLSSLPLIRLTCGCSAGAVPQPDDWLHAFRAFRQCTSSRGASAFNLTDQFINSSRLDVQAIQRRAFQQMHTVMHESLRQTKRQLFRQAMSCTLSVDDKKPYRLVRFKLTTVKGEVHQGMLCLLYPVKKLMDSPPEEWGQGQIPAGPQRMSPSGVRQFCTPRDAPFDQELVQSRVVCRQVLHV